MWSSVADSPANSGYPIPEPPLPSADRSEPTHTIQKERTGRHLPTNTSIVIPRIELLLDLERIIGQNMTVVKVKRAEFKVFLTEDSCKFVIGSSSSLKSRSLPSNATQRYESWLRADDRTWEIMSAPLY